MNKKRLFLSTVIARRTSLVPSPLTIRIPSRAVNQSQYNWRVVISTECKFLALLSMSWVSHLLT
ncbi:hypothetical protein Plhal304r1_c003g0011371 [Plasmopara halstedii]